MNQHRQHPYILISLKILFLSFEQSSTSDSFTSYMLNACHEWPYQVIRWHSQFSCYYSVQLRKRLAGQKRNFLVPAFHNNTKSLQPKLLNNSCYLHLKSTAACAGREQESTSLLRRIGNLLRNLTLFVIRLLLLSMKYTPSNLFTASSSFFFFFSLYSL